jgi:hypothetical protein
MHDVRGCDRVKAGAAEGGGAQRQPGRERSRGPSLTTASCPVSRGLQVHGDWSDRAGSRAPAQCGIPAQRRSEPRCTQGCQARWLPGNRRDQIDRRGAWQQREHGSRNISRTMRIKVRRSGCGRLLGPSDLRRAAACFSERRRISGEPAVHPYSRSTRTEQRTWHTTRAALAPSR